MRILAALASGRLQLIHASGLTALTDVTPRPQVVYLDPMFLTGRKALLVKRSTGVSVVGGPDLDADGLLEPASVGDKRVVVKRRLCRRWRMSRRLTPSLPRASVLIFMPEPSDGVTDCRWRCAYRTYDSQYLSQAG